jgi:hypothetical protein
MTYMSCGREPSERSDRHLSPAGSRGRAGGGRCRAGEAVD